MEPKCSLWPAVMCALFSIAAVYALNADFYAQYQPFGDDFGVLAGSLGQPLQWIKTGFSQYFVVYPEWTAGMTSFFRPVVNVLIRFDHQLFGEQYWLYFLSFYLAQLCVCVLVCGIVRMVGASSFIVALCAIATAVNPAFISLAIKTVAYQFDVWCGLLAVLSFYLLLLSRYGVALLVMLVAVFTKEPALYVPPAAAITVFMRTRRPLLSIAMLTPLACWLLVRQSLFTGSLDNIYVLHSGLVVPLKIVKGVLIWPSGVLDSNAFRQIFDGRSIRSHVIDGVLIAINLALWGAMTAAAISLVRHGPASSERNLRTELPLISLIWLAGALSFGVLLGQDSRYGGCIYPFEILFAGSLTNGIFGQSILRVLGHTLLLLWVVLFVRNVPAVLNRDDRPPEAWAALLELLRHDSSDVVYVVNAPRVWTSSPSSVGAVAGFSARVVILSQFEGCSQADDAATRVDRSTSGIRLDVEIPACAQLELGDTAASTLATGISGTLRRGMLANYRFPRGAISVAAVAVGGQPTVNLGQQMRLDLHPDPLLRYTLLAYDWARGTYAPL